MEGLTVVPAVIMQLLIFQVNNIGADVVEETLIVGNY